MKVLGVWLILSISSFVQAGTCDRISGAFHTASSQCRYSFDGVAFFEEGYKAIDINFEETSKALVITMNVGKNPYKLNFTADGKTHEGRSQYEGETYVVTCEENHIHSYSVLGGTRYPMLMDFSASAAGRMVFKQRYDGNGFIRVCEMERR